MPAFEIRAHPHSIVIEFAISIGRKNRSIAVAAVSEAAKALLSAGSKTMLTLDFKRKFDFDSRFLRQITPIAMDLRKNKKKFLIVNARPDDATLVRECGLDSLLQIVGGK